MPIYDYQCSCGKQFEKSVRFADKDTPQECLCGKKVPRVGVPDTVAFTFNQKTSGMAPQNTGVSSFDANADRIIGTDAKEKWALITKRVRDKRTILRDNPDVTPDHITRLPDGHYSLQPEPERRSRAVLNNEAIEALRVKRGATSPTTSR